MPILREAQQAQNCAQKALQGSKQVKGGLVRAVTVVLVKAIRLSREVCCNVKRTQVVSESFCVCEREGINKQTDSHTRTQPESLAYSVTPAH